MSKSLYYVTGILAVLLALGGLFLPASYKDNLRHYSLDLLSPVIRLYDSAREKPESLTSRFRDAAALAQENVVLKSRNSELEMENVRLQSIQEENARLREMLAFRQSSNYKLMACRVIERDVSNWWNTVLINRGWEDKVEPGLPVVTARGIVGRTDTVGRNTTRVILLVDENCKISAITENSRAQGIVSGATSSRGGTPVCQINFVNRNTMFTKGERVLTTGLGGTFPPDLIIGTVSEAPMLTADKNFGLYREGTVEPSVDLNNLDEVFVILGGNTSAGKEGR